MAIIRRRIVKSIFCPKKKRYESIYSCALNCKKKCEAYHNNITIGSLQKYCEKFPDYEIIGVLMPKKTTPKVVSDSAKPKEKLFWIIGEDNTYQEVAESEIIANPKEYLSKEIWEKPPNEFEIVIALRKKKN